MDDNTASIATASWKGVLEYYSMQLRADEFTNQWQHNRHARDDEWTVCTTNHGMNDNKLTTKQQSQTHCTLIILYHLNNSDTKLLCKRWWLTSFSPSPSPCLCMLHSDDKRFCGFGQPISSPIYPHIPLQQQMSTSTMTSWEQWNSPSHPQWQWQPTCTIHLTTLC